jgi:hypothetical protein
LVEPAVRPEYAGSVEGAPLVLELLCGGLRRGLLVLRRTPWRADSSSAEAERAERWMEFDPHPRLPNAIYSGSVRVWAAAWKFYPG